MILMSKITDGAGHGIESVQVILTTAPGSAFDATTGDEIASSQITETDADGSYSFEINNLTNVFPVGTYYKVRELIPNSYGGERLHTISSLPELGPVTLSSVKDGGTGSLTPSSVTITPVTVNPLDRQNHFGTQLAATISDFAIAVAAVGVGGSMTGAEILAALAPVDGSGSGLDADTLDGINSAGFDAAGAASSAETAAIVAAAASAAGTYQTLANIDTDSAMAANSDTKYASQKATKTALAAKAPTASPTFTGTVTVPDATANTAAAALRQAMFAEVAVPLVPTYYVRSPAQLGTTTGTPTLNLMTCVPIVFTNAGTLVSIAAANNANTATAVCRLGLYADNGSGQPGALIDDYGTVDFSTGPGTKTIVISRAVTAMTLYWLAAVEQTAATSAKVASNGSGSGLTPGYTTPLNSTIPTQCWTQASVSAGLPNPAVVTATGTSSIIVEVKI